MPKKSSLNFIILLIMSFYSLGCTDLFTNPNSKQNSSGKIGIKIIKPSTGDTIGYYGNNITYEIKKDIGINFIELYINGKINRWNPADVYGNQPIIPITLDSTMIGQRINLFLIYYDTDGLSVVSDTIRNILVTDVQLPPYKPYDLNLLSLPPHSLVISWKDSTKKNLPGYQVWRKIGYYDKFNIILSLVPGTYNTVDDNFTDTTVYYYTIKASNKFGDVYSDTVCTYGEGGMHSIAPPENLKAVPLSRNMIQLTWLNNIHKETYLKIERRNSWSNFETAGLTVKGSNTFTDSANGLVPGLEYIYRIKAISGNDSSWSNEASATTLSN